MTRGRKSLAPEILNLHGMTPSQGRTRLVSMLRKLWRDYSSSKKGCLERCMVEKTAYTVKGNPKKKPEKWYVCELCGTECRIPATKTQAAKFAVEGIPPFEVDHHPPIAEAVNGTWDSFIDELVCRPAWGLIGLCKPCHASVKSTTGRDEKREELDRIRGRNQQAAQTSTSTDTE